MPDQNRRRPPRRRNRPPIVQRTPRSGMGMSNSQQQDALTERAVDTEEEKVRFKGLKGLSSLFDSRKSDAGASKSEPEQETELTGGDAAVKAAYLTYIEGVALHGAGNSWETTGSNRGPLVDAIQDANNSSGQEWCGMFIGDSYKKAGIREEILQGLVFWSGYRLHLFFTEGRDLNGPFGDWWKPHQTLQIGTGTGAQRKEKLDAFGPQPGDVALFRSDYSHVGMVTSYDSATGTLEIIEGNRGNRVQASVYDTGNGEITFLGRFNSSDYGPGSSVDEEVSSAPMPEVTHGTTSGGTR